MKFVKNIDGDLESHDNVCYPVYPQYVSIMPDKKAYFQIMK